MRARRIISLLLALFLGISAFVSCKTQEKPRDVLISEGNANGWTIVYPDGAAEDVVNIAFDLYDKIEAATGVKPEITTDFEREGTQFKRTEHEILVGETNRDESLALDGLLCRDYAVTYLTTRVAI